MLSLIAFPPTFDFEAEYEELSRLLDEADDKLRDIIE